MYISVCLCFGGLGRNFMGERVEGKFSNVYLCFGGDNFYDKCQIISEKWNLS